MPRPTRLPVAAATALLSVVGLGVLVAHAPAAAAGIPGCSREGGIRWQPRPTTAPWQWQLQGKLDISIPACVYDIDGFETPKRTVAGAAPQGP